MEDRPFSVAPECLHVRAIYDFKGQNNDELNLTIGDVITITQTPEGGWFEGTLNGVTGWFPSNYVEAVDVDGNSTSTNDNDVSSEDKRSSTPTSLTFDQSKEYRKVVINEIIEGESNFIKELNGIHRQYLSQVVRSQLPRSDTQSLINSIISIISTHSQFLTSIQSLLDKVNSRSIKAGGVFMEFAARFKDVHSKYCSIHPKFVSIVDRHKDIVANVLRPSSPVVDVVIHFNSSLSLPFRRLDKYPALLQELQRYTHEADPDRGNTQRAGHFFRELVSHCLEIRRQKEMEVEVILGNIKNLPEDMPSMESLGELLKMASVIVIHTPYDGDVAIKDRFLVLFERDLLLLSVSREMTSFTFEDWLPMKSVTLPRIQPTNHDPKTLELLVTQSKKTQECSKSAGHKFSFLCPTEEDVQEWMDLMKDVRRRIDSIYVRYSTVAPSETPSGLQNVPNMSIDRISSSSGQSSSENLMVEPVIPTKLIVRNLLTSDFWLRQSLLPHHVLSLADVYQKVGQNRKDLAVKSSASDDVSIFQVIEGYCSSSMTHRKASKNLHGSTINRSNSSASPPATNNSSNRSGGANLDLILEEMKNVKGELQRLRMDLNQERESRLRLERLVHRIVSASGSGHHHTMMMMHE